MWMLLLVRCGSSVLDKNKLETFIYVRILNEVCKMEDASKVEVSTGHPKHMSALAGNWFLQNKIDIIIWPCQSSKLNPIENLWRIAKQNIVSIRSNERIVEKYPRSLVFHTPDYLVGPSGLNAKNVASCVKKQWLFNKILSMHTISVAIFLSTPNVIQQHIKELIFLQ